MIRQLGTALVDPDAGFIPAKSSTALKLEALNLEAQANALPVSRQRRRRTDSAMIKFWAAHGKWPSRYYLEK
jgi:hypothetical protein